MIATRPGTRPWRRLLGSSACRRTRAAARVRGAHPAAWTTVRLLLFWAGPLRRPGTVRVPRRASRALSRAGNVPLVLANGVLIGWVLLALGRDRPFTGDFGLVGFWVVLPSGWPTPRRDGRLRLGVVWRWARSPRRRLAAGDPGHRPPRAHVGGDPTIVGPLALAGIGSTGSPGCCSGWSWRCPGCAAPLEGDSQLAEGRRAVGARGPCGQSPMACVLTALPGRVSA